jgi:hypothetical protein
MTLSIFNPLPVHKLREASIRWPPRPTEDLWSGLSEVCVSDTRKMRKPMGECGSMGYLLCTRKHGGTHFLFLRPRIALRLRF